MDLIFAPSAEEMYPWAQTTFVDVTLLTDGLCGKYRPGHFRGVATVVLKLLNIVQPHRAYFGEKDAQQLAVIRRMVQDLMLPVSIVAIPTVREPDGLAMSSRNARLNAEERRSAAVLYAALRHVEDRVRGGATGAAGLRREALDIFAREPGVRLEYFEIVDPGELQPVQQISGPVLAATAAWVGGTRLIDNITCLPAA